MQRDIDNKLALRFENNIARRYFVHEREGRSEGGLVGQFEPVDGSLIFYNFNENAGPFARHRRAFNL